MKNDSLPQRQDSLPQSHDSLCLWKDSLPQRKDPLTSEAKFVTFVERFEEEKRYIRGRIQEARFVTARQSSLPRAIILCNVYVCVCVCVCMCA